MTIKTLHQTADDLMLNLFIYSIRVPINESVKDFMRACLTNSEGAAATASLMRYNCFSNEYLSLLIAKIRKYFEKEVLVQVLAAGDGIFSTLCYTWKKFAKNVEYFHHHLINCHDPSNDDLHRKLVLFIFKVILLI